ncbi:MAG: site-specific integrase [Pseudomonadota bacterium]
MSLTDAQVKRLKNPEKGQRTYFDDALPGFGVRVSQGGTKTFIVLCGRERKRKSIGRYPTVSLAEARARAKGIQSSYSLEQPTSPFVPKLTYEQARDAFLDDSQRRNRKRTYDEYHRLLHRHFKFKGDLKEVDRHKIVRVVDRLKKTPSEQKHAFVAIRTMMNWCFKRGYIDASPVPPLTFPSVSRSRVLSQDELRLVWRRAEEVGYPFGTIVQLLILTGQRRNEIVNLRRSWIYDGAIHFPKEIIKNKREHVIPLGKIAANAIEQIPTSTDMLFPSRLDHSRPFNGFSRSKRNFDLGLDVEPYTLHDLRRSFSSLMAQLRVPIHVTERILNHSSGTFGGISAVYNRYNYYDEMRDAILNYEANILAI